jgi:repressor LexA
MLTQKQKDLLMLIHSRLQATGVPPSFDEMKDALQLKSKSGIHRLITALEERGFIRRLPHRARALEIIKMPEASAGPNSPMAAAAAMEARSSGFQPSVIEGGQRRAASLPAAAAPVVSTGSIGIPLMGKIAAGVPIAAIQDHTGDVQCPPELLGTGDHFALVVKGDSMIDVGIHENDIVIIHRQNRAENGEIVVALVEGEEATLKRLRRKGASVALEAANPKYETRIFGPDQVEVQGKLVGLIRKY